MVLILRAGPPSVSLKKHLTTLFSMKILAFSDTHLSKPAFQRIKKRAQDADILICAGDISWFGIGLKKFLIALDKIGKPIYIIHGNHEEPPTAIEKYCSKLTHMHFVHKKVIRMDDKVFFFWGGGGFAQQNKEMEKAMDAFKKTLHKEDKVVLVTHGPPFNTALDFLDWAGHVGCKSGRLFLQEIKPVLHISGHLHEHMYEVHIFNKKTILVNAGPAGTMLNV